MWGATGHFELNVLSQWWFIIFTQCKTHWWNLCVSFNDKCFWHRPLHDNIRKNLDNSLMLVTALNTKIGYYKAAEIATNRHKSGRTLKETAISLWDNLTAEQFDEWVRPELMVGQNRLICSFVEKIWYWTLLSFGVSPPSGQYGLCQCIIQSWFQKWSCR